MFNKGITLINIALFAALTAASLVLVRDAISHIFLKAPKAKAVQAEVPKARAASTLKDFEPLIQKNVFGIKGKGVLEAAMDVKAPDFEGITLQGTVMKDGGGPSGHAVFLMQDKEEIYWTGELVPGAGKLIEVRRNSVVLGTADTSTELMIATVKPPKGRQPKRKRNTTRARGNNARLGSRIKPGSYVLDRKAVEHSLKNPGQILTDARLLPNMKNGVQQGFSISEVRPDGLYYGLGLRDGDVLLRVNDLNISRPEAALQAFTAIGGLDTVQLDILRNGRKKTLNYYIR